MPNRSGCAGFITRKSQKAHQRLLQKLVTSKALSPNELETNPASKAIFNYYKCKIDDVKAKLHIILSSPYYDATPRWTV